MLEIKGAAAFHAVKFGGAEDPSFRIRRRRNKRLGLWAASQLGLTGHAAEDYAQLVVAAGIERFSDDAVLTRILSDLAGTGTGVSEATIRKQMERFMKLAALELEPASPATRPSAA